MISADEWQQISAGLVQRARLLNLTLQDLYGTQSLIADGVLPPELVFGHPRFLRPCLGVTPQDGCHLHFYAADIVRGADGRWWVLADRTEAPSGLGYALENRIVVSRMLPDAFHHCQVERLAPFFIAAQQTLRSLAPQHRENPRVVLLSHGPTSPNYFEDAYLARYLGYTLVEGGDLDVRGSRVVLKTLGGLLPVDVILRRQNGADCDSLEFASPANLGIAGLTQAWRAGNVGIANALGSGLVESTAYMAFMPQLCQALLGENLALSGVATWWCGSPNAMSHVLKNLSRLVVHPAFRRRGFDGPTRDALSAMSEAQLVEQIRARPINFAAQERVERSCAPVWGNELGCENVALRVYLVASGDSYVVMPGALARLSASKQPLEVTIRQGERSKDTWIMADRPVEHVTLLGEPGQSIQLRRSGAELPSRVADGLYWLGRQLERAEALARLLRSTVSRIGGETRSTSDIALPVLLRCLADKGQIEPGYAVKGMSDQLPPITEVLPRAVFDTSQPESLRSILDELYRLASVTRDRIALDTWRIIHSLDETFRPARGGDTNLSDLLEMTDKLITGLAAVSGMLMESTTRTQAFYFLELGRRLERSLQTVNLVANSFVPLPDPPGPVFEAVLEVADSLMTYRSRYLANLQLAAVLDLLLTDETNPRSLAYQFRQIAEYVDRLPRDEALPDYTTEQRLAMSLLHSVRMMDIRAVAELHMLSSSQQLERLLDDWETRLPKLSEAISHHYLVHAGLSHQLADISPQ
ncbi:MAG: circularly permuted type 2 ATP-grasp protein [Pirellulales bacterium]